MGELRKKNLITKEKKFNPWDGFGVLGKYPSALTVQHGCKVFQGTSSIKNKKFKTRKKRNKNNGLLS